MKYIIDNGGIGLESEYPYLAEDSRCNHRKADHRVLSTLPPTYTLKPCLLDPTQDFLTLAKPGFSIIDISYFYDDLELFLWGTFRFRQKLYVYSSSEADYLASV